MIDSVSSILFPFPSEESLSWITFLEIGQFCNMSGNRRFKVFTCSSLKRAFVVWVSDVGGTMSLHADLSSVYNRFIFSLSASFSTGIEAVTLLCDALYLHSARILS